MSAEVWGVVDALLWIVRLLFAAWLTTSSRPIWRVVGWVLVAGVAAEVVANGFVRGLSS